jgi:hypothetical protein
MATATTCSARFLVEDEFGNWLERDGSFVYLVLPHARGGKARRRIAKVTGFNHDTLEIRRDDPAKHYLHSKGGKFGFANLLFSNAHKWGFVWLDFYGITDTGAKVHKVVKIADLVKAWTLERFAKKGYELQGFVDETFFGYVRPEPKKAPEPPVQGSLF